MRSRLRFDGSATEVKPPGNRFRPTHAVGSTASAQLHHQVSAQNEDENAGVQAAHQGEEMAEGTVHTVEHAGYSKKLKAYDKAAKLERRADKANVEALYQQKAVEAGDQEGVRCCENGGLPQCGGRCRGRRDHSGTG